jgi:periplasmic divalent cation tolerance protein
MPFVAAYITCPNKDEAQKISLSLLKDKLIACSNMIPCDSMYLDKGKIQKTEEFVIIAKAKTSSKSQIILSVKKLSSYEIPCINFLPVDIGNLDYAQWLERETKK